MDNNACRGVGDLAEKMVSQGKIVYKGSKTDPLDDSVYLDLSGNTILSHMKLPLPGKHRAFYQPQRHEVHKGQVLISFVNDVVSPKKTRWAQLYLLRKSL